MQTVTGGDFSGRRFDGETLFADTRFEGATRFDGAVFAGPVSFQRSAFAGDVSFAGARFEDAAAFGRVWFGGRADFGGAEFGGEAWFGRGTETWWDDDERWDTVEDLVPVPFGEPNAADPDWPVAVLVEDYQDWEEGGAGASFAGDVSFRGARFAGPAWFYNARFAAGVDLAEARFGGRVRLDHPAAELSGAHWSGDTADGPSGWPLGWTAPERGGPLGRDDRPGERQAVVTALCALLRAPALGDLRADESRRQTQRRLVERLREWPGLHVNLCAAVLVDLDLGGCAAAYADFCGAQFHGTTRFAGSRIERAEFSLDGPSGHATFHGDAVFDGPAPEHAIFL
ncbi:pentapeptide repeat-containing protein [Dactylosporangium sp. CS-033363]|uniref:pentapeptide repeat-containing protein n=1 Tax=Dactylosporangium sp. CS-033363 TaxID=3239935 RepID=UPI003D8A5582